MSYLTSSPNRLKFGPPAGSSNGIQLVTMVTVLGSSGLRKAYRSVASATGSCEISGASRWLDAPDGRTPASTRPDPSRAMPASTLRFLLTDGLLCRWLHRTDRRRRARGEGASTPRPTAGGQHAHDAPGITDGSHGSVETGLRSLHADEPAPAGDVRAVRGDERLEVHAGRVDDARHRPGAALRARARRVVRRTDEADPRFETGRLPPIARDETV